MRYRLYLRTCNNNIVVYYAYRTRVTPVNGPVTNFDDVIRRIYLCFGARRDNIIIVFA
jgi:hypothetical protein